MLDVTALSASYGEARVLTDVSITVLPGEVVTLVGRNGAGKTSLLRAAMGLMPRVSGGVSLNGTDISREPAFRRAQRGLGYVPEDRRIFMDLTIAENLRIAARPSPGGKSRPPGPARLRGLARGVRRSWVEPLGAAAPCPASHRRVAGPHVRPGSRA